MYEVAAMSVEMLLRPRCLKAFFAKVRCGRP
jgi:hypothetical protein